MIILIALVVEVMGDGPSGVGTMTSFSTTSAANAAVGRPVTAAAADMPRTSDRRVKEVSTMKP